MPSVLEENAIEQNTYVIIASFFDEDGDPVSPNAGLKWCLTNDSGDIINGLVDQPLSPATQVTIVLTGDDLLIIEPRSKRVLTIEGEYDSTLGTGLSLKDEARFDIDNLTKIE